jgi:hypothetical protein
LCYLLLFLLFLRLIRFIVVFSESLPIRVVDLWPPITDHSYCLPYLGIQLGSNKLANLVFRLTRRFIILVLVRDVFALLLEFVAVFGFQAVQLFSGLVVFQSFGIRLVDAERLLRTI